MRRGFRIEGRPLDRHARCGGLTNARAPTQDGVNDRRVLADAHVAEQDAIGEPHAVVDYASRPNGHIGPDEAAVANLGVHEVATALSGRHRRWGVGGRRVAELAVDDAPARWGR